jgi:hypothetical protein
MQKDRSSRSDPQATTSYPPSEIVLAMRDKLPKPMWSNIDAMLFERNKSRDLECRVCEEFHNAVNDSCGCDPR